MSGQNEETKIRTSAIEKSNLFIQQATDKLTPSQKNLLCYIISLVKPALEEVKQEIKEYLDNGKAIDESTFPLTYGFDFQDILKIQGWSDNKKSYDDIKNNIKSIADLSVWLPLANGMYTPKRFIEKAQIDFLNGHIEVKIGFLTICMCFFMEYDEGGVCE